MIPEPMDINHYAQQMRYSLVNLHDESVIEDDELVQKLSAVHGLRTYCISKIKKAHEKKP